MKYLLIFGCMAIAMTGTPVLADDDPAAADEEQNLFDTLDEDGNGRLTSSEIPEDRARFFRRLLRVGDDDEDGELTREEFREATREPDPPAAQPGSRQPGGPQRGRGFPPVDQLFEQYDANDDDKLTLEEIPVRIRPQFERIFQGREELTREQLTAMRERSFSPEQVAGFLRRLDRDGNGKLKLADVPEQMRPRLEPVFERLDSDELDVARLAEALTQQPDRGRPGPDNRPPGSPPPGRGPVVLRVLDSDRDGRISREELAAAAEKFDELDRNGDGQIDAPELFGFPPDGRRPGMQQPGRRPQRPGEANERPRRPDSEESDARPERPRRPAAEESGSPSDRQDGGRRRGSRPEGP